MKFDKPAREVADQILPLLRTKTEPVAVSDLVVETGISNERVRRALTFLRSEGLATVVGNDQNAKLWMAKTESAVRGSQ
ncbi:MAG: hypothetical protein AAFQ71_15675 [Planctomycetota bacterium]